MPSEVAGFAYSPESYTPRPSDDADADLRRCVEELIDALRRRVLENDALLNELDERDQTIAQLEATIKQLEAELRRARVNRHRVRGAGVFLAALLTNAAVSFGAAAGGTYAASHPATAKPTPAIEQAGPVGDDVRSVLKQCEELIAHAEIHHVSDSDPFHLPRESASIEPEGHAVETQADTSGINANDVAGGSDAATTRQGANVADDLDLTETVNPPGPTGPTGSSQQNGPDGPNGPTGFTGEVGIPGRLTGPEFDRPATVANAGVAEGTDTAHDATVETNETPPRPLS